MIRQLKLFVLCLSCLVSLSSECDAQYVRSPDFSKAFQVRMLKRTVRLTVQLPGAISSGSGVVVETERDGFYVVTAPHVIDGGREIKVETFTQGGPRPTDSFKNVRPLVADQTSEFALLYVQGRFPLSAIPLCPTRKFPKDGAKVLSIGCDGGDPPTCHVNLLVGHNQVHWATSERAAKGRSGGPLITQDGYVIGACCGTSAQMTFYSYSGRTNPLLAQTGYGTLIGERAGARAGQSGHCGRSTRIPSSNDSLFAASEEHKRILKMIPDDIQMQWAEILNHRGNDAVKILESTRNRFDPIYGAPQTKRMFGTMQSRLDVESLIRGRRIVILNLAQLGKLPKQLGSTIGSLILNEVLETVFNMSVKYGREAVEPTYCLLDEFQQFSASHDIEEALPTCRQMGLRLILAHQSFSQLKQQEIDLTGMIWQARNRLMFANSAEDADIIANELATLSFNRMEVKDLRMSRRQLISGYRTEWLQSMGKSHSHSRSEIDQRSVGYSRGENESRSPNGRAGNKGTNSGHNHSHVSGGSTANGETETTSWGQQRVPIHDNFEEVSNVTYLSFEEHRLEWMKKIRQLETGQAVGKFVDDSQLHHLMIRHRPVRMTKVLEKRVEELLQRNFEQDVFISSETADQLAEQERIRLMTHQVIALPDVSGISSAESSSFRTRKRKLDKS